MLRIAVVTPVYNDWESLQRLIPDIDAALTSYPLDISIIVVNDGSSKAMPESFLPKHSLKQIRSVEVLDLCSNMGHQRAIALGLAEVSSRECFDIVIVMDSDGEDQPANLPLLLQKHMTCPDHIVVAKREKRSEGLLFRIFYLLYKLSFKLLTGITISHGNYSLIPIPLLKRLLCIPDLSNHLAATIVQSGIPIEEVSTNRGVRYAGKSRLNFVSLITLGLSAISIFAETSFVRIFISSLFLAGITAIGIILVVGIRMFTDLAIPGWASYVAGLLVIILLQVILLSMIAAFLVLSNRSGGSNHPAHQVELYVVKRKVIL